MTPTYSPIPDGQMQAVKHLLKSAIFLLVAFLLGYAIGKSAPQNQQVPSPPQSPFVDFQSSRRPSPLRLGTS